MKRILKCAAALLLVIAMVAAPLSVTAPDMAGIPAYAAGATGKCGDEISWSLSESGVLSVSGSGEMYDFYWGYAPWIEVSASVKKVELGEGITRIGQFAFGNLSSLETVSLPESLEVISSSAFCDCTSLTGVFLPSGVRELGYGVFQGCTALAEITVSADNPYFRVSGGMLFSRDMKSLVWCSALKEGELAVPSGVTGIEACAFAGSRLSKVTLPDSVRYIGDYTFAGSDCLEEVVLPSGLIDLSGDTFSDCTALKTVVLPEGLDRVGDSAFYNCASLEGMVIPESVTYIGYWAFSDCDSLTVINVPAAAAEIGAGAFGCCDRLRAITVDGGNESYKDIDGVLFTRDGATLLCCPAGHGKSYTVPSGTEFIYDSAFSECEKLEVVSLPNTLRSIGGDAFYNCSVLDNVVLPNGLQNIEYGAFASCSSLSSINIPASVENFGDCSFMQCGSLTAFNVDPENAAFCDIDGVMFDKRVTTLVAVPGGYCGELFLPAGVSDIITCNLLYCHGLTAVNAAPDNTGLKSADGIVFDKTGKNMIYYPAGRRGVYDMPSSTVEYNAFAGCSIDGVILPEGKEYVDDSMFANCENLKFVYLPASIGSIADLSFMSCNSMTDVYFGGSEKQWNSIYIAPRNDGIFQSTIHYNCTRKVLSYDGNGGNDAPSMQYSFDGTPLLISSVEPVKPGFEFLGWNTKADGSGTSYAPGCVFDAEGSTALYAQWLKDGKQVEINYSANVYSTGKPRIEWDAIDGAVSYQVYRTDTPDGRFTRIGSPTKLGQTDNKAQSGKLYYYKVRAVFGDGSYGPFSYVCEIFCKPARPVISVAADKETGSPLITWNAAADAVSYQVYRSDSKDGKYTRVEYTDLLASTDVKAVAGCSYYYKVRSVDSTGMTGAFSLKVVGTAKCAKPVVSGTNVKSTGKPRVTWAAVAGAEKYQVYRAETADGKYTKIGTPTSLGQTDSNAVSGKTYYYKVRAVDSKGTTGAFSSVISVKCK